TLRPDPAAEVRDGTVRNHVSLERATRQAAPQRLFQNRVTPALPGLCFLGVVESRAPLDEEELGLLQAAASITDQIGGGRGRGLGLVSVSLAELPAAESPVREVAPETTALLLVLEAEEPLHLSSVKDPTNYVTSKDYLDGSTVRGAVAAALGGTEDDADLDLLLAGESPAVFGDGRPGGACAIPAPMTLQVSKRGSQRHDPPVDLAALLCAEVCAGRPGSRPEDVRTAQGTFTWGAAGWHAFKVKRRTVTRTARDHASGRAADGQLFSLEVVDPVLERAGLECGRRLRFYVPVFGSREQLALALKAAEAGLAVGGDRSRGFGRLRLVDVRSETPLPPVALRHAAWAERVSRLGVPAPESTGVLLAVGPLAVSHQRLVDALAAAGLELVEGVARRHAHGGWNAKIHLPRSLSSHYLPGSTFVVVRTDKTSALPALAGLERDGLGPGRPDGWGRLIACHPIHVDCCKEE
ncbi:MAG TPA: RAMP superfamily CRISPR-associated protein, partial [Thermoanaerobaculia bacterium]|nr:RAMP superfamily CRISPR-associated protein [Thermoanaerobaculia bacterium]